VRFWKAFTRILLPCAVLLAWLAASDLLVPFLDWILLGLFVRIPGGSLDGYTPIIVAFSVWIAFSRLHEARRATRQRATLDLIEKAESTEHYLQTQAKFRDYVSDGEFLKLMPPRTEALRKDRRLIQQYLNHYELVAIGIRKDFLDETTYRDWMRSTVIQHWNEARDFIQFERKRRSFDGSEYDDKLYENYQWLAMKWSTTPSERLRGLPNLRAENLTRHSPVRVRTLLPDGAS